MSKSIVFTKTIDISDSFYPKPSSVFLPDWYKKTNSYIGGKKEVTLEFSTTATIKKCIPVFDALTSGYIISTYCDVLVSKDPIGNHLYRPSDLSLNPIEFHSTTQAPYHPSMNQHPFPKWINPWGIKTPSGYSTLFINPVHSTNQYFTILEGVVDTDNYFSPVNFPFVLKDVNFEGVIPAGTPIAQIIPIKRDIWKHSIGSDNDLQKITSINKKLNSRFFDRYKNIFWNRKEYK